MIEQLWVVICTVHLTVCSCHVTYAFQNESTLYSCLNVKELVARNRREIWSLSDCNWTQTHDHLVHKRTFNHLAKLAKRLSCVVRTYLYGAFDAPYTEQSLNNIPTWNLVALIAFNIFFLWPIGAIPISCRSSKVKFINCLGDIKPLSWKKLVYWDILIASSQSSSEPKTLA